MPPNDTTTAMDNFKAQTAHDALTLMRDMFGEDRAREAAQHVAVAFRSLARVNPKVAECTRASVAQCLAMCALTRLMPGGAMPGVYLIPRSRRVQDSRGNWGSVQELNFQIGFRGLLQLAQRAGYTLAAYPVYIGAPVKLDHDGRLVIPEAPQRPVRTWENLIGVTVTIHTTRGEYLGCQFVAVDLIEARRNASDSWIKGTSETRTEGYGKNARQVPKSPDDIARDRQSPWFQWPEEMALKTALTYVIRRGYVPLDDVSGEVLAADARSEQVIDTTAETVTVRPATRDPLAALRSDAPALPDNGEPGEVIEHQPEPERVGAEGGELFRGAK